MSEKKRAILKKIYNMEEGLEFDLNHFQISGTDATGQMRIADFEVHDPDEGLRSGYQLKPGFWKMTRKDGLIPQEVAPQRYFETDSTREINKHLQVFVDRQDVYERRGLPKKRGILLYSPPGNGKSSCLRHFVQQFKSRDDVAILFAENGDALDWEVVSQMWLDKGKNNKENPVNLAILIVEDIGGSELAERGSKINSEMLNFMDANTDIFKIPTLIIGTTNFINLLGDRLNDRPGRFDKIIEVKPPKDEETLILAEEFLGREFDDNEKRAILGKGFTPAYCKEVILRHELYDISIEEAVKELEEQRKKSRDQKHGKNNKSTGFAGD